MKTIKKYDFICHDCGFEILNQKPIGKLIRCKCEEINFVDCTKFMCRYGAKISNGIINLYYEDGTEKILNLRGE